MVISTGLVPSLLAIFGSLSIVSALNRIELYPFGTVQGDQRLNVGDDVSSADIHLRTAIAFYDEMFTSLFINMNGMISFETELPAYRSNLILPLGHKIIAPFLADVDINLSGNVYYRESRDPSLIRKATESVQIAFPTQQSFLAGSVFIVTWDDVGFYQNQFHPTNTFQLIIASNGQDSFAAFLYPDDGINWIRGEGKDSPVQEDPPAQVGFDSGPSGRYYLLPGSGNQEVNRLSRLSNFGVEGMWMFHIGKTRGRNIGTPELSTASRPSSDSHSSSCSDGGQMTCNANARCTDYDRGFCCECSSSFIGNGRDCIRPEDPQRVSGKVSGNINGVRIDNVDLHAYVLTTDGRTYTAISRIPPGIGFTLQSVYTVGSVLGFLFALPQQPSAKNGFMIAGGQFNRTATLQFQSTRDSVTVRQSFTGQDAEGHMRMSMQIDGNVPRVTATMSLEVDDYTEVYQRVSPGVIRSQSTQTLRVDGVPSLITIDQTINYEECASQPLTDVSNVRINVTRNFLVYSEEEEIVRFSQTNRVFIPGADPVDTCRSVRCGANADCVPEGRSYRCVCRSGFQGDGQQGCREMPSSQTCDVLRNCHADAVCEYDHSTSGYLCKCSDGFRGDGYRCQPDADQPQDCSVIPDLCDVNAQCVYESRDRRYSCRCNEGFDGDGQRCGRRDCRRDPRVCDTNARCDRRGAESVCVCNPGFRGDGYRACTAVGDRSSYLMYAQGMYIMETPFTPRGDDTGKQTLYIPGQTAIGVDVDCQSQYFYWTDVAGKTINKARLDGTDSEVIARNVGSPEGIAVDWLSKNVYWTDSVNDRIDVSRQDGTHHKTLFSTELVNPRSIAIDPIRGVMFWTDWNRDSPKIEKSNMDGSDRSLIVSEGLGLPNCLAIDFDLYHVCWGDAGTRKIECVNYDGRNRRVISQSAGYPFGLVYAQDTFYWTDWERSRTLPNINKNSDRPNEHITLPVGANGRLYGLTAVRNPCPSGSNPCIHNNGGCRFLCLPSSRGGRTCACPDDISADECNRIGLLL